MNLVQFINQQLTHSPVSTAYRALLEQRIAVDEADTFVLLPSMMSIALGGTHEQTLPITAMWHLLRHAGRLLDDFQDGVRALDNTAARADLNASTGYLFAIGRILATLPEHGISVDTATAIATRIYADGLHVCGGQHDDLTADQPSLEQCWAIAKAKTGAFCRVACWSGARLVTDDAETLAAVEQLGFAIGMLNQIRDDVTDLFVSEASDFVQKQAGSLAIGYARDILPSDEKQQFLALLTKTDCDEAARQQARAVIVQCGATLYLATQSYQYHQQAIAQLEKLQLPESSNNQFERLLNTLCFYDDT